MHTTTPTYDLAVSIVTYNDAAKPILAGKSILSSVRKKVIVIFEDNSPTMECVEALRAEFERMTNVSIDRSGQNLGYGKGNNRVLFKADSRYVLVLNPDVVVREGVIETLIDALEADESIIAIAPAIMSPDGTPQYLCRRDPTFFDLFVRRVPLIRSIFKKRVARGMYNPESGSYEKRMDVDWFSGAFMLLRTADYIAVGGFDERYFMYMEDADLCRRLRAKGRIVYEPAVYVTHEWSRGSYRKFSLMITHLRSALHYFRKWRKAKSPVKEEARGETRD